MSNTQTNRSLKTLCRTAIFLALLIAVQFVTRSMGQYVTGSLVNLILIASGLMCGLWGGLAVAVLSPICAFFIGIGPAFPQVVPAVALGNAVLVNYVLIDDLFINIVNRLAHISSPAIFESYCNGRLSNNRRLVDDRPSQYAVRRDQKPPA